MRKIYALLWIAILMLGMGLFPAEAVKPVDNDGDGVASNRDCNDNDDTIWELNSCGDCALELAEGCGVCEVTEDPEVSCSDGIDNDCDTLTDSADSDCQSGGACADYSDKGLCNDDPNCEWDGHPITGSCIDVVTCTVSEDPEVSCSDGNDNDCDGLTDCDDSD